MIRRTLVALALAGPAVHWPTGPLAAQDISIDGTVRSGDEVRTGWRIGIAREWSGAAGQRLFAFRQTAGGGGAYDQIGAGFDLTLFERGRPGLYLVGGLTAGVVDHGASVTDRYWGWSAGVGYEIVPISFLALRAEGRWRTQYPTPDDGIELSIGTAIRLRTSRPPQQRPYTEERRTNAPTQGRMVDLARAEGISGDKATLVAGVVATATGAMGTPYQWGGTGGAGGGFDCSGLIQYAYRQHGIQLPRTSSAQALVGVAVEKELGQLAPGDILTFSNSGGHVTHVALYVGEGKIIHSANGGVQMSVLSPTDSYGRWWWNRWVGVRRVVR